MRAKLHAPAVTWPAHGICSGGGAARGVGVCHYLTYALRISGNIKNNASCAQRKNWENRRIWRPFVAQCRDYSTWSIVAPVGSRRDRFGHGNLAARGKTLRIQSERPVILVKTAGIKNQDFLDLPVRRSWAVREYQATNICALAHPWGQ